MRIMEKKMETTVVYWAYVGIMEKKMETRVLERFLQRVYQPLCLHWTPFLGVE